MRAEAIAQEEGIEDAFKVFDTDGNGFIDTDELRDVMLSIDPDVRRADIEEMIKQADASGDGQIDIDEFLQILKIEGSEIVPARLGSPTAT